MIVVLINPDWGEYVSTKGSRYNRCWPPLSLLNCAALLEKEGVDVKLLDFRTEIPCNGGTQNGSNEEFAKQLEPFDKIFVTSSPVDRWQCPNLEFEAFLQFINQIDKSKLYIMGVHGTILPEKILELTNAKAIIRGEPEYTVLELCRGKELNEVEGLTFFRQGRIVSTNDRTLLNLNDLPMPGFHLIDFNNYYYEILGDRFALFEGSRGCPASCIYCLKAMYGKGYRKKSSARLIDEVEYSISRFNVKSAYFIDLEFTINRVLVEELCEYLIKKNYNFQWCCQTRADTVDIELLMKMKEAGCQLIHYGVETGSEKIMKLIKKKITHLQIEDGIANTKKAGIEQACFFLFGFPSETENDMVQTIEFAKKLNPTYASFHIVSPYPGTPLFDYSNNQADVLFPEFFGDEHTMAELQNIVKTAYKRFYFRPGYVFSRLLKGSPKSWMKQYRLFKSMS